MAEPWRVNYGQRSPPNSGCWFAIIVAILSIIGLRIIPFRGPRSEDARPAAALNDVWRIRAQLEAFRQDVGRYPTGEEGLAALTVNSISSNGRKGPYLSKLPCDPWGRPYGYISSTREMPARVFTLGHDGLGGTLDDITEDKR